MSLKYIQGLQNENAQLKSQLDRRKDLSATSKNTKRDREERENDSDSDNPPTKSSKLDAFFSRSSGQQEKVDNGTIVQGSTSLTAFGEEINHYFPKANVNFSDLDHQNVGPSYSLHTLFYKDNTLFFEARTSDKDSFKIHIDLPPFRTAVEYFECFMLFLGDHFYFFNPGRFKRKLEAVYSTSSKKTTIGRGQLLYYITMLFVLSLGKMYVAGQGDRKLQEKFTRFPGFEMFQKGTSLLHFAFDELQCGQCSLESLETLILYAFYHQIVDASSGHYIINGMAVRTALTIGIQKNDCQGLSLSETEHRNRLFWTLYGIDRYCSAKLGYPLSIPDELITADLPSDIPSSFKPDEESKYGDFSDHRYITCYVELCRIFTMMLRRLYQPKKFQGDIVPVILSVLSSLHMWQQNLPDILKVDYTKETLVISRTVTSIHSEYFRCINLTIRPLLLHFVRKRLHFGKTKKAPIELSKYSSDVIALLNASLQASIQTIRSHSYLLGIQQLAKFGYLDREYIYSAISTLVLFNVAFGVNTTASQQITIGLGLLKEMEQVGNMNAQKRKEQTEHLIKTFEDHGIPTYLQQDKKQDTKRQTRPKDEKLPSMSSCLQDYSDPQNSVHLAKFGGNNPEPVSSNPEESYSANTHETLLQSQKLPSISMLQNPIYESHYASMSLPPPSPQPGMAAATSWSPSPVLDWKEKSAKGTPIESNSPSFNHLFSTGKSPLSNPLSEYSQNFTLLDQNGPDMFDQSVFGSLSSFRLTSDALGLPVDLLAVQRASVTQSDFPPLGAQALGNKAPVISPRPMPVNSPNFGMIPILSETRPPLPPQYQSNIGQEGGSAGLMIPNASSSGVFSDEQEQNLWQEVTSQGLLWFGSIPEEFKSVPW